MNEPSQFEPLKFYCILSSAEFLKNLSNLSVNLDPDEAQQNVKPDLGPNCLENQKRPLAGKELTVAVS